jgi:hypothetical protein
VYTGTIKMKTRAENMQGYARVALEDHTTRVR